MPATYLSIGQVAARSGIPISTLHFYERKGLIVALRNDANHRVFRREVLRRVTIIKVAQAAGVPLSEIAVALADLAKDGRADTEDWAKIARLWHQDLSLRIAKLTALRDKMSLCIGCGCLSVKRCPLVNKDDHLAGQGPGAQLL